MTHVTNAPPRLAVVFSSTGQSPARTLEALAAQTIPQETFVVFMVEDAVRPVLGPLVERFSTRLNLSYRVQRGRGKAAALNTVLRPPPADLIAFTDDDCTPAADWLEQILDTFARFPDAAVVSGQVIDAAPAGQYHRSLRGLTDPQARSFRGIGHRPWEVARGVNFAIRRRLLDEIGLFDTAFGPGAPMSSGLESEWILRVLEAGHTIRYEPSIRVVHARGSSRSTSRTIGAYYAGTGAMLAKHLSEGRWDALGLLNPFTFFRGARRNFPKTFLERLATAVRTVPYLFLGIVRYFRFRRLRAPGPETTLTTKTDSTTAAPLTAPAVRTASGRG